MSNHSDDKLKEKQCALLGDMLQQTMPSVWNVLTPVLIRCVRQYLEACVVAAQCEAQITEMEAAGMLNLNTADFRKLKREIIGEVVEGHQQGNK